MYMGPVVAAQQVLDPSPQHPHLREEKKGGGGATPAATKSSGVFPRVYVSVTYPDVHGKVFYILICIMYSIILCTPISFSDGKCNEI